MTTPTTDAWADLPVTPEQVGSLSHGLLDDSAESAGAVRSILSWVRRYCGWHVLGEITETITVDGSGSRLLQLPTLRVVAIASVSELSWSGSEDVDTPIRDRVDFTWSTHGVLERRRGCWTRERRGVTVTLTHGFADADVVLGVIVAAAARQVGAPGGNVLSRVGDIAYQSSGAGAAGGAAFLQSEYAVLDHYRLNSEV